MHCASFTVFLVHPFSDIGGCDKQIQELIEAVVLPMTQAERFTSIGIRAPKGVLLYGPPGMCNLRLDAV